MNVFWFFPQVQKMTTSLLAHRHFFVFFSSVEDDDEPRGLSLSLGFFPQM
jgi:hypothetical protein